MKTFYPLAIIGIALLGRVSASVNVNLSACFDFSKCLNDLSEGCRNSVGRSSEVRFAVRSKSSDLSRNSNDCKSCSDLSNILDIIRMICKENNNAINQTVSNAIQCILMRLQCIADQLEKENILPSLQKLLKCLLQIDINALSCQSVDCFISFIIKLFSRSFTSKDDLKCAIDDLLKCTNLECLKEFLTSPGLDGLFKDVCSSGGSSGDLLSVILALLQQLLAGLGSVLNGLGRFSDN